MRIGSMGKSLILLLGLYVLLVAIKGRSVVVQVHYLELQLKETENTTCGVHVSDTYSWAEIALHDTSLDVYSPSGSYEVLARGPALLPYFPFHLEDYTGADYAPFPGGLTVLLEFDTKEPDNVNIDFDWAAVRLWSGQGSIRPQSAAHQTPIHLSADSSVEDRTWQRLPSGPYSFVLDHSGHGVLLKFSASLEALEAGVLLQVNGLLIDGETAALPGFCFFARSKRHIHWAIAKEDEEYLVDQVIFEHICSDFGDLD